jgi:ATP-dependent Lon protease
MNTLSTTLLPVRMPVRTAAELSAIISAQGEHTSSARFLCLLLLRVSWTSERPRPLLQYLETLERLEASVGARHLLEELAHAAPFQRHASDVCGQVWGHVQRLRTQLEGADIAQLSRAAQRYLLELFHLIDSHERLLGLEIACLLDSSGQAGSAAAYPPGEDPIADWPGAPGLWRAPASNDAADVPSVLKPRPRGGHTDLSQRVLERIFSEGAGWGVDLSRPAPTTGFGTLPEGVEDKAFGLATGVGLEVYSAQEARRLLRSMAGYAHTAEGNARLRMTLEALVEAGGWRRLAQAQEPAASLAELRERFPHFGEVLDFVERSLALAACGQEGSSVRFAPVLLRGEPGTGKTCFAQELARTLGVQFVERDLSVTTEAFVLSGMDSSWKGSKPGAVFEALAGSAACEANPLICLNEVDKASSGGVRNSPLSALYALLEPASASRFIDEFVGLPINASRVLWVLTANDGFIPAPLLSRLEVFEVREPSAQQMRQVGASVWRSIVEHGIPRGAGFSPELPDEVLEVMAGASPRQLRRALTHAAGVAVLRGQRSLDARDLRSALERCAPRGSAVGFLAGR